MPSDFLFISSRSAPVDMIICRLSVCQRRKNSNQLVQYFSDTHADVRYTCILFGGHLNDYVYGGKIVSCETKKRVNMFKR